MFRLFKDKEQGQLGDGPFGLTIGQRGLEATKAHIMGSPVDSYPYGSHGELFDEKNMHSFYKINPPQHHKLFSSFYGRYVNAYGEGRQTGLSRVIACSNDFDERETNCVLEFFNFLERLQSKYGISEAIDTRSEIIKCNDLPDRRIPESLWRTLSNSKPRQVYTSSWDLTNSNTPEFKKLDQINLRLFVKSSFGLKNIRYDRGYLALEYVFVNDRNADEIYAEEISYRGERDDEVL